MAANYSRLDTFRRQLLAGTAAYGLIAAGGMGLAHAAGALPQGGQVIGGSASISYASPTQLNITSTTGNSAIAWQSFSIGQGNSVNVAQPSANSTQLEQVNGPSASQIFGSLSSNGRIVVANPNGIWFGPSAQVDVAGLVATTAHASPADVAAFAAGGNLNLSQAGTATASVVNQGTITISQAGLAAFVAPGVANQGVIQAKLGTVQLASGTTATVDFYGDGLINLAVTGQTTAQAIGPDGKALAAAVNNTGTLNADGGTVLMTANTAAGVVDQVINTTGIVQARAVAQQGGQIVLDGGDTGTVMVAGTLDASGRAAGQTGGTVNVLGNNVQLASNAVVDVSGDAGGGTALIGGNFHGAGTQRHAATTTVAQGAKILADAVSSGNGGQVAIWADQSTSFDGTISAKGGAQGGNGGQVETSGAQLSVGNDAVVDASAANGSAGTWELDPATNLYLNAANTVPVGAPAGSSSASTTAIQASLQGGTNQTETASADIVLTSGVSWSSGATFELDAGHNLFIEAPITHTGATPAVLNLSYNGGVTPNLLTATNAQLNNDGRLFIFGSNVAGSLSGAVTLVAGGQDSLNINSTPYTLITNLNSITPATAGAHYALDADINCTATPGSCTNFATGTLAGTLEGLGHTVSNLTFSAASAGTTGVGLFSAIASTGVINDFGLVNSSITITAVTSVNIGSIAGTNNGVVTNSFVKNGILLGPTSQPVSNQAEEGIGGLVGTNEGLIMSSFTDNVAVTANGKGTGNGSFIYNVAGFVGFNDTTGRVVSSFATNTTINQTNSSGEGTFVAGFIGDNKGSVMADIYFGPLTLTMNGHPTSGTFAAAGNCSGATPVSCTAGSLNITLTTDSKPYDGTTSSSALPTASGLAANGDSFYSGLLQEAFSSPNVGTAIPMTLADSFLLINYGGTTGPNYFYTANNPAPVMGTITARPLTITASNVSTAYGTTPVALTGFTVAPNGLVNGETISSVTETSTDNVAAKDAGTYTGNILITAGSEVGGNGFLASNYSITLDPGTLTITPSGAAVVITANNQSTAYGTTPIPLPGTAFTVTGLVAGNQIGSVTETSTDNVAAKDAGTYTGNIVITQGSATSGGGTGFNLSNYSNVTYAPGTLTITPSGAAVVITANNQSTAYGTTPIPLPGTAFTVTGLVAGNQIGSVTETSTDNVAAKDAGTYTGNIVITQGSATSGGGTGFNLSNYSNVTYAPGTLTITPSGAAVVITANNQSTAYGTTPIPLPGTAFTVTGLVAGNQIGSVTETSTDNVAAKDAGTYTGNIVITQGSATSGGGTGFNLSNYSNVTYAPGTLTITPSGAAVVITANNQSTAYGTTPIPLPGTAFTVTGLVAGNQIGSVTETSTDNVAAKDAGTYTGNIVITQGSATSGGGTGFNLSNYSNVTYAPGTLTITPSGAAVVITANNQSTAYGTTPIPLPGTAFTVTGLVAGNQIGSVTETSTDNVAAKDAGTYTGNIVITQGSATSGGGTGFNLSNYSNVTYAPGTLTITPSGAAVVITANNQSTAYGTTPIPLPGTAFTVTGLVAGNQIGSVTETSTDNVAAKDAGTYTGNIVITQGSATSGGGTGFNLSNYSNVTYAPGTLTITPSGAAVVITANNQSTAYGTTPIPLPGTAFTVTGLVAGNQIGSVTETSTDNVAAKDAGTYTGNIVITQGSATSGGGTGFNLSNYSNVTYAPGTLTITPSGAAVVITANNQSTAYGTTPIPLPGTAFTVTGLVAGNQIGSVTETSTDNVAAKDAGTYTGNIVITQGSATSGGGTGFNLSNYSNVTYAPGTLTITPSGAAVVITANNQSTAYGTTPIPLPGTAFTVTGLVAGNQIGSVTETSTDNVAAKDAGTYTGNIVITQGSATSGGGTGFNLSNYSNVTYAPGTLTITPSGAAVVITANNQSTAYGTTPIPLPGTAFTVTGLVAGNQIGSVTETSTDNVAAKDAGTYTGNIVITQGSATSGGGTGFNLSNYSNVTYAPGTLTITPSGAAVVITANNQSTAYGTTPIPLPGTAFTVTGLVAGNQIGSVTETSTDNVAAKDAGTYTGNIVITQGSATSGGGTGFNLSNYSNVTYAPGTLTITPSGAAVVITANNQSTAYGTTPIPLPGTAFTVTGLVAGNQIGSVTETSTDNVAAKDAGTYTGNIVITQGSATSGGGTGFNLSNYSNVTYAPGTLTITPSGAAVVITANNQSTAYGTTPIPLPGTAFTVTGLVAGNQIGSVTETSTDNVAAKDAGTYTGNIVITQGSATSGGGTGFNLSNYSNVTYAPGTLTITPSGAAVVITANNQSTAYGTTPIPLPGTAFTVTGLVAGNQIGSVTETSTDNVAAKDAGTYTGNIVITQGSATSGGGTGFNLSNYSNVTYAPGTLTITPSGAAVVITANNQSTAYGTTPIPLPGTAFTVTGLVAGNQIGSVTETSTDNVAAKDAGTYTGNIIASAPVAGGGTGFLASNYASVSFVAGNLTITPSASPVVITAANQSTAYGTTPITLNGLPPEFTVAGLVAGNQIGSVTLTSTDNVVGKNAGTYTGNIIASAPVAGEDGTGFLASNYASVSFVAGNLTITPSASLVVITAANQSQNFGSPFVFTGLPPQFSVTGLVAGNTISSVNLTSSGDTATAAAGTYPIIPSGGTGNFTPANYLHVTYVDGTLTVVGGVPICAATFPQCTVPLNVINLTTVSNPGQSLLGNVNPAAGNNVEDVNPAAGGGAAGGICEQLPNDERKDECFDRLAITAAMQQNVDEGNKFLGGKP